MQVMLAGKFIPEKAERRLPLLGQIKYDGVRCFIRGGVAYSRSVKPIRNTWFQSWVARNQMALDGVDGEIICGDPTAKDCYRRSMQFAMTYDAVDDFRYYAFDVWNSEDEFQERFEELEAAKIFTVAENHRLIVVETTVLETIEDVQKMSAEKLAEGHEGIIVRAADAQYKNGRGTPVRCECIKVKDAGWTDTEVRIIDLHEQLQNANEATVDNLGKTHRSGHQENLVPKNTLGAMEVTGKFPDGREFQCRVGSGMDDALRKEIWSDRSSYIGRVVKMKYFTVGIKDKPRFPIFLGFRDADDMDAEPQQGVLI